jgi:hypothetical protein
VEGVNWNDKIAFVRALIWRIFIAFYLQWLGLLYPWDKGAGNDIYDVE